MARCEMCGKEAQVVTAEVEGVDLKVCPGCAKHGTVKRNDNYYPRKFKSFSAQKNEPEEELIADCAQAIRNVRERLGMTQEQFSKYLNERESVLAKWESGAMSPSIDMAKRLEKRLGVNLIRKSEAEEAIEQKQKALGDTMTLGDFIKIKTRK